MQLPSLEWNQLPVFSQLAAFAVTSGEALQVWTIGLSLEWVNNLPDTLPERKLPKTPLGLVSAQSPGIALG